MNPILATEIVTRFFLWVFLFSAEVVTVSVVERFPPSEYYMVAVIVTFLTITLTLFLTNIGLVWDIREILFYEFLAGLIGWALYKLHYPSHAFVILATTFYFLKFCRLVLPAKLIDENNTRGGAYASWPVFGLIGLVRSLLKKRSRNEGAPHSFQAYTTMFVCLMVSVIIFLLNGVFPSATLQMVVVGGVVLYFKRISNFIYSQNALHIETTNALAQASAQREQMLAQLASKNAELQAANEQREEMLVDLAKRNEILRDASHDLAQPLMGISYFARQLTQAQTEHEQEDYAQKLISSVDGLGHLIDDTIHNAKITTKLEAPTPELVSVEYLADRLWAQFLNAAHDKGIGFNLYKGTLSVFIDPKRPERGTRPALDFGIMTDEDIFWRIISNLIINAINNTEEGRILVAFRQRKNQCWVEVHDTGSGIANADSADRVANFHNFAESIKTRYGTFKKGGGHGLGVNNVRQLCSAIGTEMELFSRPGKGSIFSFKVPLATYAPNRTELLEADSDNLVTTDTP